MYKKDTATRRRKDSQKGAKKEKLGETSIERYEVERTNKAEIRPEDQSEKAGSCRKNLWNEIQLKGPQRQKQTQERNKRSGQTRLDYVKDINRNIPTT